MTKRTPFEAAAALMRAEIQASSRTTQKRNEDTVLSAQDLIHGAVPDEPLRQAELAARAALAAPRPYRLSREVQDALVAVAADATPQGLRRFVCACDAVLQNDDTVPVSRIMHEAWRDHSAMLLMMMGDRVGARMAVRRAYAMMTTGDHTSLGYLETWTTLIEAMDVVVNGRVEEDDRPDFYYRPSRRESARLIARNHLAMLTEVVLLHEAATDMLIFEGDPDAVDMVDLERPGPLRRAPLRPTPKAAPKAIRPAAEPEPEPGPALRPLVSGSLDHLKGGPLKDYRLSATQPLKSVAVPDLAEVRERLVEDRPWAASEIARIIAPLAGRDRVVLGPYLFVGGQGTGKTEGAVAVAEALGLPTTVIPCGGLADGMYGGTSRAWSTTRLGGAGQQILTFGCMTVAAVHDELDKTARSDHNGSHHSALLAMLEPTRRHAYHDPALEAACDLSGVSFLATANSVEPLRGPLLDRFTVIQWPAPRRQDLPVVARGILRALRREGGDDPAWTPDLDAPELRALQGWQGGSMRPLRRAIERLVALRSDPRLAN
ncbi:AAA family ATPase [Methylobacterium sp. ARG-1]|uniref:AAA family ATPase n=1 Tax=Methylobacterium sp. ARG-1 TaxID=1692501 RepID=UPI0006837CA9|nr:AAA family ATPase [Methylobacterium sp. ARG-1]